MKKFIHGVILLHHGVCPIPGSMDFMPEEINLLSIGGWIVGLASLLLAAYMFHRDYRRFVELGPIEPIDILTPDNASTGRFVRVANDTKSLVYITEIRLKVVRVLSRISDEQIDRFIDFIRTIQKTSSRITSTETWKQAVLEQKDKPDQKLGIQAWTIGFAANLWDKLHNREVYETNRNRFLDFLATNVSNFSKEQEELLSNPDFQIPLRILLRSRMFNDDFFSTIISQKDGFLLTKGASGNLKPKDSTLVPLDYTPFVTQCQKVLEIIGGKFTFECYLEAQIFKARSPSRSHKFKLQVQLPVMDMNPLLEQMKEIITEFQHSNSSRLDTDIEAGENQSNKIVSTR